MDHIRLKITADHFKHPLYLFNDGPRWVLLSAHDERDPMPLDKVTSEPVLLLFALADAVAMKGGEGPGTALRRCREFFPSDLKVNLLSQIAMPKSEEKKPEPPVSLPEGILAALSDRVLN